MAISIGRPTSPLEGKYEVDTNGCHLWIRAKNNRGYGVVWYDGKLRLAHRVSWLLEHGRWPADGLVVDHACNIKACVNVAHLRELPNHANLRRAIPRGNEATEARRLRWREANQRRRNYGPHYSVGGE